MRNDLNWDDLGHRIEDAVNWAVNSRNYEHLNQTIRQPVEQAVDLGSEAVKKAAKTVHYQPPKTTVVRFRMPPFSSRALGSSSPPLMTAPRASSAASMVIRTMALARVKLPPMAVLTIPPTTVPPVLP